MVNILLGGLIDIKRFALRMASEKAKMLTSREVGKQRECVRLKPYLFPMGGVSSRPQSILGFLVMQGKLAKAKAMHHWTRSNYDITHINFRWEDIFYVYKAH